MKKVLLLTPRLPWPEIAGGEIRVASLLRHMAAQYEFTVLTFGSGADIFDAEAAAVFAERRTGAKIRIVKFGEAGPPPPHFPAIADGFRSPGMARALAETARAWKPDLIQLEFTQMAQYAELAAKFAPVVMTEHDSGVLWPESTYHRGAGEGEQELLRAHVRRAFASCAKIIVVSGADATRLATFTQPSKLVVVPTGVDLEKFPFKSLKDRRAGEAVFVGHFPHYPNEEAAVRIAFEIMPELRRLVEVKLRLVGSGPTQAVKELGRDDVEVVGEVAEVAPHLQRARVFLAPMRLGYGIKGKILEAFACGTPVVASPEAYEAMPGIAPGVHLLSARGAAETAQAAARVLKDDVLSKALAGNARAYVEERFAWPAQAKLLDEAYRQVLSHPRRKKVKISR